MFTYEHIMYIGTIIMLLPCILSIPVYKTKDTAAKILALLLAVTFIAERVGNYFAYNQHSSNQVYAIFSSVEILLISMYFNFSIDIFRKRNIGIFIGIGGFMIGILDFYFIQDPAKMNNLFLLTESIMIVAMCLYSFYRMLITDDDLKLGTYPHFWFTAIFLFFWTSTFVIWGLYDFMIENLGVDANFLQYSLLILNIITYAGFSLVFLFYKKMKTSYAK